MKIKLVLLFVVVGVASAAVLAQDRSAMEARIRKYAELLLRQYDRNKDGVLDREESKDLRSGLRDADSNGDGRITVDELVAKLLGRGSSSSSSSSTGSTARGPESSSSGSTMGFGSSTTSSGSSGTSSRSSSGGTSTAMPSGGLSTTSTATPSASSTSSSPTTPGATTPGATTAAPTASTSTTPAPGSTTTSPALLTKPAKKSYRFLSAHERLPQGLPEWFKSRDANQDGQITLAEFAPELTEEKAREFEQYDLNHDGFVTPSEILRQQKSHH